MKASNFTNRNWLICQLFYLDFLFAGDGRLVGLIIDSFASRFVGARPK